MGGGHRADNLVTCCWRCNSSRGAKSVGEFARRLDELYGLSAAATRRRVRRATRRQLGRHRAQARVLHAAPPVWLLRLREAGNKASQLEVAGRRDGREGLGAQWDCDDEDLVVDTMSAGDGFAEHAF